MVPLAAVVCQHITLGDRLSVKVSTYHTAGHVFTYAHVIFVRMQVHAICM